MFALQRADNKCLGRDTLMALIWSLYSLCRYKTIRTCPMTMCNLNNTECKKNGIKTLKWKEASTKQLQTDVDLTVNTYLNKNVLNTQIKNKFNKVQQDLIMCHLEEANFKYNESHKLKIKKIETVIPWWLKESLIVCKSLRKVKFHTKKKIFWDKVLFNG